MMDELRDRINTYHMLNEDEFELEAFGPPEDALLRELRRLQADVAELQHKLQLIIAMAEVR